VDFTFHTPATIRFGLGVSEQIHHTAEELGGSRAFIITSCNMPSRPRFIRLLELLKESLHEVAVFNRVSADPAVDDAETCHRFMQQGDYDLVVGVGGGSVMDVAKLASMLTANPGSLSDYFGVGKVLTRGLPTVLVPTTSGSGSEVSPDAVLVDRGSGTKKAVKDSKLISSAALIDPAFAMTMDDKLAAVSGIDALTHAVEAYVSTGASTLTDMYALKAIELIMHNLPVSVRKEDGWREAREAMALASTYAGLAFGNAGTAAAHACAYPISGMFAVPHGTATGLMLPYVTEFNLGSTDKYEDIERIVGHDIPRKLLDLVENIGLPTRLGQLGIPRSALADMAERVMPDSRHLSVNPREIKLQDLETIYEHAY